MIVCTGPSSVAQRVRGLRLGADAWMTKPCHPEELICVIEAAVRRHRRHELPQVDVAATIGEITIRPDLYQAYVGEQSLELTAREFEILQLLAQSDRVLRREEIYERVWGYAMAHGDRSVDVFVRKLRQKLRAISPAWSYIHTHFGVGYRFAPEPEGAELDEPSRGRRGRARAARGAQPLSRLGTAALPRRPRDPPQRSDAPSGSVTGCSHRSSRLDNASGARRREHRHGCRQPPGRAARSSRLARCRSSPTSISPAPTGACSCSRSGSCAC